MRQHLNMHIKKANNFLQITADKNLDVSVQDCLGMFKGINLKLVTAGKLDI